MTDRYPPFRLDLGGDDPGALAVEPDAPSAETGASSSPTRWSGGRVAAVVAGSVVALVAAGLLSAGIAGLVVDQTQRDGQGFVMTSERTYSTGTYALVSDTARVDLRGPDWGEALDDLVGDVKLRVTSDEPVFVGVGPAKAVSTYLAQVSHEQLSDLRDRTGTVTRGVERPAPPQQQSFWVASASGAGEQSLSWDVRDGAWRAVVMSADGGRGVNAQVAVGAELPALLRLSVGLAAGAVLLLAVSGLVLVLAVRGSKHGY